VPATTAECYCFISTNMKLDMCYLSALITTINSDDILI